VFICHSYKISLLFPFIGLNNLSLASCHPYFYHHLLQLLATNEEKARVGASENPYTDPCVEA
jgi:hypothetical protein